MFAGKKKIGRKVKKAVDYFSNYDLHLLHSRPLFLQKLLTLELNIELAEIQLQDLLWEAYILINGFFSVSPFVKLFETIHGVSWGRQFHLQSTPKQQSRTKTSGRKKH